MDFQLEVEVFCLFGTLACACLIQVGSLRSPRQAHARTANKRKRKIQSRAVAESPAEPLGRTSAITLGGFLDRFRFWTFVGAPPCGIVSPRIIIVRPREKTIQLIIKTRQARKLTNLIPICYPFLCTMEDVNSCKRLGKLWLYSKRYGKL